jgi:putative hydrolase of the HAD superfamily
MSADLRHIDTWLFDLDNTLYPIESGFMGLVADKMTLFVARLTGLPRDQAYALQKKYLAERGTTLAGLMANHQVDPDVFLADVHDVPLDGLVPDPALRAGIQRLPGRRLVFTNGDRAHAERILERLELDDLFEATFHIASADYVPKPHPDTFDKMVAAHAVTPATTAFFEDTERNLKPAADLGMTTVLVGAHGAASTADFVHYRTSSLPRFLLAAQVKESRP